MFVFRFQSSGFIIFPLDERIREINVEIDMKTLRSILRSIVRRSDRTIYIYLPEKSGQQFIIGHKIFCAINFSATNSGIPPPCVSEALI